MPTDAETATAAMIAESEISVGQCMMARTIIEAPRPNNYTHRPTDQTQHNGLDQKLPQDVIRPCADCHAQADFPRPFGDRDQHDIHDSHAAYDQRDESHYQEQAGHQLGCLGQGFGNLGHIAGVEIVWFIGMKMVPLAEQFGDLIYGLWYFFRGSGLDINLVHVRKADRLRSIGLLGGRWA